MTYSSELAAISRTPVTLMVMTLDFCAETFGSAPCTATGDKCYNTYPTCKDKTNFNRTTKDYKFVSADAPLPFKTGERPYITSITHLPTEIKDSLTVNARVVVELADEPDTDIGIDPYVSTRSSVQGTFWKKLLARNPNFKGRTAKAYEGFLGLSEGAYEQKFVGMIDNIKLSKGKVRIEIADLLTSLSDIEMPPKLDIKLIEDITDSQVEITLTTVTGLDSPSGYVRINDEIIYYTAVNDVTNVISGITREYFSTTKAEHSENDKVQKVRYYAPANPFNILKEMLLTDADIASGYVDSTNFDYWRDWPGGEVNFSAIVSEPTKLSKLYFEIVDLIDCKSWVGEDLKITIRRNIPNEPGRSYTHLSDEANIVENSASVDLNPKSRISRVLLYWDKSTIGDMAKIESYGRLDITVEADAESDNEYAEVMEKKFFCRWLRSGYVAEEDMAQFIENFSARQVWRQRDAMPLMALYTELKDSDIKTGEYVRLSTDELLQEDGNPLDRAIFQIVKRDPKKHKVSIRVLKITPARIGFIAPDATPDYASASEADKEYGFITDNDGLMADGTQGYHIW